MKRVLGYGILVSIPTSIVVAITYGMVERGYGWEAGLLSGIGLVAAAALMTALIDWAIKQTV